VNNKKYFWFILSILSIVIIPLLTESCADNPSSLGLKFILPGDTTGVRIFDSYIDTMLITSTNVRKRTNTSGSPYMLVGNSGSYNSKALLRFDNFSPDFDSATIISATLTLSYENYYYPYTSADSLGQIGFDIFKVQQPLSYTTITLDSVNANSFGTVSQGNYTGFLTADSQQISINLNTSMVKDWLEYAADTNYPGKNYGIALSPNGGSNVIKGFFSTQFTEVSAGVKPSLKIILTKYGVNDTIVTEDAKSVSLVDGPLTQGNETFSMQAGIGYVQIMKFDLSHIPSTATINDVLFYLTIDSADTKLSTSSSRYVDLLYVNDTLHSTSGYAYSTYQSGNQYIVRLVSNQQPTPFQRWLDGQANFGLQIAPHNYTFDLDEYSFFNVNASDRTKRPHVVIKYTPRITHK